MNDLSAPLTRARQAVAQLLQRVDVQHQLPLVPAPEGLMQLHSGMHFHFSPEVFIQLEGATAFRFPQAELLLGAGQIAVLPAGLPHAEQALDGSQPFCNLVVILPTGTVQWHLAKANARGHPVCGPGGTVGTRQAELMDGWLTALIQQAQGDSPQHQIAVRGLLLAFLGVLQQLLEQPSTSAAPAPESHLVARCRLDVHKRLSDPDLGVQYLADRLGCSPNYLSHLFGRQTGTTLIEFIHRQRIAQACRLLEASSFSTKELAHAVGFRDPTYFIRVFRKRTGRTPLAYRAQYQQGSPAPFPAPNARQG